MFVIQQWESRDSFQKLFWLTSQTIQLICEFWPLHTRIWARAHTHTHSHTNTFVVDYYGNGETSIAQIFVHIFYLSNPVMCFEY